MQHFCYEVLEYLNNSRIARAPAGNQNKFIFNMKKIIKHLILTDIKKSNQVLLTPNFGGQTRSQKNKRKKTDCLPFMRELIFRILKKTQSTQKEAQYTVSKQQ